MTCIANSPQADGCQGFKRISLGNSLILGTFVPEVCGTGYAAHLIQTSQEGNQMNTVIGAVIMGTISTCALIGLGWQSDEAILPQVMLIVGGWLARSVVEFIKGE